MSQRSSVESPQQSTSNSIQPALQAVLGCLDVNLEQELTQYRRHRKQAQQWVTPTARATGQSQQRGPDLISPAALNSQGKPQETAEQKLPEFADSEALPSPLQLALTPSEGGITTNQSHQPARSAENTSAPDRYLESSEALIKSLDEAKSAAPTDNNLLTSLFTPLGISSMLLFLLSCITLGFVVISPSGMKALGLDRFFKPITPATVKDPNPSTPNRAELSLALPKAPNLASKEFVELDLSTLSNINYRSSPIPTPSAKPSIPPSPKAIPSSNLSRLSNLSETNKSTTNDQGLNNLSTALLPSPSPSPVKPSPVPGIPGNPIKAEDGFYYVVIDFTGEQSLAQAKKAVPDAYVRKFSNGVKIQMGALSDAESAKRLVNELQEKGVTAKYYQP
ncbi:MAG: hypothetical protein ACM37W_05360 [Actinomycetota bacterium]